jgi:hypothetical protein
MTMNSHDPKFTVIDKRERVRQKLKSVQGPFSAEISGIGMATDKALAAARKAKGRVAEIEADVRNGKCHQDLAPQLIAQAIEEAETVISEAHAAGRTHRDVIRAQLEVALLPAAKRSSAQALATGELRAELDSVPAEQATTVYLEVARRAAEGDDDELLRATTGRPGEVELRRKIGAERAAVVVKQARKEALTVLAKRDDLPYERKSAARLLALDNGPNGLDALCVVTDGLARMELHELKLPAARRAQLAAVRDNTEVLGENGRP